MLSKIWKKKKTIIDTSDILLKSVIQILRYEEDL